MCFTGFLPTKPITTSSDDSSVVSNASTVDREGKNEVIVDRGNLNLRLSSVRTFIFWKCSGLPTSMMGAGDVLEKKWVTELKEVWGERLEAFDDSVGAEKALKGNRGGGAW